LWEKPRRSARLVSGKNGYFCEAGKELLTFVGRILWSPVWGGILGIEGEMRSVLQSSRNTRNCKTVNKSEEVVQDAFFMSRGGVKVVWKLGNSSF